MSDQLGQLLGYFDNDGVTELVIHTGQPISVRIHGDYRAVTEGIVSKAQLAHLMLGTPLDALSPEDERNSESRPLELGGRKMHALLIKRGKEIALTLATSPPQPAPVAYSPQITKPARPGTNTLSPRAQTSPSVMPPAMPLATPVAPPPTPPPVAPPPKPITAPTPPPVRPIPPPVAPPKPAIPAPPPPDPGIRINAPTPARTLSSSEPAQIHSALPAKADLLDGLPVGPPGLKLDFDDEEDHEATSFQPIPIAPPASAQRMPRAVSISGDLENQDVPELDSGLPRSVTGSFNTLPDLESTDAGWGMPALDPPGANLFAPPEPAPPPPVKIAAPARPAPAPAPFEPPAAPAMNFFAPPEPAVAPVAPAKIEGGSTPGLVDEPIEITSIFANIVRAARAANASDLHIAANRPLLMRTMAELKPLGDGKPVNRADVEAVLMPLLGPARRKQLDERGYVDLAVEVPGAGRLRTNISRIQGGLKGAFRLALPRPFTLEELALPKDLAKVVNHHQGLVVIAGPSGHGKTTTLAALVDLVNAARPHHILTVEDPVEIEHPRKAAVISQREVGKHTKSFAAALKASLREDPDVIVIGELRDRETVEIAMTAAETGHLVLATMSTPSAAKTIDRLIDMFPPDDQSQVRASLAGALRAIVAQRLVPTKDGKVTPAIELLTGVLPLGVLIRDNKLFQLPNLMQRGRSLGMIRLDESLIDLYKRGKISEEVAMSYADSKKEMTNALRGPGTSAIPKVVK